MTSEPSDEDKALKPVAEGAAIPQTTVTTKDHLVHLHKRGRMLVASYEALRFQKLDLFTVTLRQIGAYIARAQLNDAIDVLVNGDEDSGAATNIGTAGDEVDYTGLVSLWGGLAPVSYTHLPVRYPELVVASALNPPPGCAKGVSLLHGLPFVSGILMQIYRTIGTNWERLGDVRFAVTYKPSNDATDRAFAKDRAKQIAQEWSCLLYTSRCV